MNPSAKSSLFDRARQALETESPAAAYALVSSAPASDEMRNLTAVCLMRMGRAKEAVEVLQRLVMPREGLNMLPSAPLKYKVNFATALLLSGNLGGCLKALRELGASPSCERLSAAIERWRSGLGTLDRIRLTLGSPPKHAPALENPGEL